MLLRRLDAVSLERGQTETLRDRVLLEFDDTITTELGGFKLMSRRGWAGVVYVEAPFREIQWFEHLLKQIFGSMSVTRKSIPNGVGK